MHGPDFHQRPWLWMIAGTGEGPALAAVLLERGWGLVVSVVSAAASRAYPPHPGLQLEVGSLAGPAAITARLQRAAAAGQAFVWVVDASHPFASRVSADLAAACGRQGQPLLRLQRPKLVEEGGDVRRLASLEGLQGLDLSGERLLFAIGARHLARAVALAAAAQSFARLLPSPAGLRLAGAAGLPADQLACHRPGSGAGLAPWALEAALIRRWQITSVLCRQSGGTTETGWRQLGRRYGLRLLLLERPEEPDGGERLNLEALIARLGAAA